jgi:hypothetical protein
VRKLVRVLEIDGPEAPDTFSEDIGRRNLLPKASAARIASLLRASMPSASALGSASVYPRPLRFGEHHIKWFRCVRSVRM